MRNIVYHYTSPDGILGILKGRTLQFTDCQYLNDIGEMVYMKEPFDKAYKRIIKERGELDPNTRDLIYSVFASPYEKIDIKHSNKEITFTNNRYYVLCTSLNCDTANMWNYYVKNSVYKGYNLGINKDFMIRYFNRYKPDYCNQIEFIHGKVIYNRVKQEKMLYCKINELLQSLDRKKEKVDELYDDIKQQQLFFKHPAFASEKEYRFILKVDNNFDFPKDTHLELDFRIGLSGIITPYIKWHYSLNIKEQLFSQITLAPMIEPTLAMESFKRFLARTVKERITIKPSSIKLRF